MEGGGEREVEVREAGDGDEDEKPKGGEKKRDGEVWRGREIDEVEGGS